MSIKVELGHNLSNNSENYSIPETTSGNGGFSQLPIGLIYIFDLNSSRGK